MLTKLEGEEEGNKIDPKRLLRQAIKKTSKAQIDEIHSFAHQCCHSSFHSPCLSIACDCAAAVFDNWASSADCRCDK